MIAGCTCIAAFLSASLPQPLTLQSSCGPCSKLSTRQMLHPQLLHSTWRLPESWGCRAWQGKRVRQRRQTPPGRHSCGVVCSLDLEMLCKSGWNQTHASSAGHHRAGSSSLARPVQMPPRPCRGHELDLSKSDSHNAAHVVTRIITDPGPAHLRYPPQSLHQLQLVEVLGQLTPSRCAQALNVTNHSLDMTQTKDTP